MPIQETFTPGDAILANGWRGFIQTGTLASGLNLVKGTVLGIITASGLLSTYNNSNSDGTEVAVGILMQDVNTSSTGINQAAPVAVCTAFGVFLTAELTGMDSNGLADLGGREVTIGGVGYTYITGQSATLAGLASITGDLTIGDDLTVTDDAAIGGDLAVTGLSTLDGGLKFTVTSGTDTAFSVPATANVVHCVDFTTGRTYALPAAATFGLGRLLIIKAPSNANTHNLTLDPNSSETIDGASTLVVSTAYRTTILQAITGGWAVLSGS